MILRMRFFNYAKVRKMKKLVITKENDGKFYFSPRIMAQRVTFYIDESTLKSQYSLRTVALATPLLNPALTGRGVPFGRGGVCNILIANKILTPPQPLPYKGGEWLRLRPRHVGTF